jgi:hypothetical protein
MPSQKLEIHSAENDDVLDSFKCKRLIEYFEKEHLADTKSLIIIWTDKDDYMNSAYCNIPPFQRLWTLFLAWLQEMFDIRLPKHDKKA